MAHVLVTGGMGFIGNHLTSRLLALGHKVIVIDKSIYKPIYCSIEGAEIIEGDILSRELLYDCLQRVDVCFHLAALSSVFLCDKDWIYSHENNVLAFNGLLYELTKINKPIKLIYASSAAVYGLGKHLPFAESEHVVPLSTYGADKLSNELYANVMAVNHNIQSIGLRFFNVYGPGQLDDNPYSGVITAFKKALLAGQELKIYGDGQQTRDFVYIDDVINALILSMQTPETLSGIYNICTGNSITVNELARIMINLSQVKVDIEYYPERLGDLKLSTGKPDLAQKMLQFKASIDVEEGLNKFLSPYFL
jgi:UDP-glucose 4-epimerase